MNLRQYNTSDYSLLEQWWKDHDHQVVPENMLSSLGFVVEKDNTAVMCGFVYLTNSKISILEFIVSSPELNKEENNTAINLLISGVEKYTKTKGYEYCMMFLQRPKLKERFADRGYIKINENVDIMLGSL